MRRHTGRHTRRQASHMTTARNRAATSHRCSHTQQQQQPQLHMPCSLSWSGAMHEQEPLTRAAFKHRCAILCSRRGQSGVLGEVVIRSTTMMELGPVS